MKTLELDLKKKVLIIENAEYGSYFPPSIIDYTIENENGEWKLLCKGSELTEEIASELVDETLMYEKHKVKCYRYRSYRDGFVGFDNAIDSFISAVESKGFYWLENPIEKPKLKDEFGNKGSYNYEWELEQWQEAEEKTFHNPLIFVKK